LWLAGLAWLAGLGRVGVVWPHDCKQLLHPSGCGGLLVACLLAWPPSWGGAGLAKHLRAANSKRTHLGVGAAWRKHVCSTLSARFSMFLALD